MVIYGSPAIGKSFTMKYVLKDLEREGKINPEDYFYYSNFKEEITKEHERLLYKTYHTKTIDNLIESRLKELLNEQDLKLVIFDNLKEKEFLNIDFSASNYKYNSNGKGVICILSFKEGFRSKIDESNIELLEIPDITGMELQILKDRHFRRSNLNINPNIRNINDLLKMIKIK